MNVMTLDLELNQPSKSIIQIGICIGNIQTGEILEKLDWIIKQPEEINPFITKLTTITQEMVDGGVALTDAYDEIVRLYKKHECELNMVTWGGGDHWALKSQLYQYAVKHNLGPRDWEFGHREFDVKTLFLAFALKQGLKVRSGLAKSMTRVGMNFKGTKHWAPDDARNTFDLMVLLVKSLPDKVLLR